MTKRQIKLGLFVLPTGQHIAAWRLPETDAQMHLSFDAYRELAQKAEAACFDLFFLADTDGIQGGAWTPPALSRTGNRFAAQFEPMTLLSSLAAVTRNIGLVGTASTTYYDPYRLARQFASLDLLSGGRAGWNIVTSHESSVARNYSMEPLEHDARYERASEFVEVVEKLWHSWDHDAFVRDKHSGQFFRPEALHSTDHRGTHFSVAGPLNVARSPQGQPVFVQAGSSGPGRSLAATHADIVFTAQSELAAAQAFYADLKARVRAAGRDPDAVFVMPGVCCFVAETAAAAQAKFDALQELIDPVVGLAHLGTLLGVDLTGTPLDEPVVSLPVSDAMQSRHALFLSMARQEQLTLRQLYQRAAGAKGHLLLTGTASEIVDTLETWIDERAADGFNVMPPSLPQGFDDFTRFIVPELRSRGRFREAYEGTTLRASLGLPVRH